MIEKIKQNPIKVLGIAAGIFFLAAILFMLLPGISYAGKNVDLGEGVFYNSFTIRASLFAFAFGGKLIQTADSQVGKADMRVNGMIVCPLFLFAIALILAAILICCLFKGKISNKKKIILTVIIGLLIVAASGIIFASKTSMTRYVIAGKVIDVNSSLVTEMIKTFEAYGKFSLGVGAILSPIMMLLGAGSIVGAVALSNKETK